MSQPAPATRVAELNSNIRATRTLHDAASRLVEARDRAEVIRAALAERQAAFQAEFAWLFEDKKAAEVAVMQAEADVRTLARAHYDATRQTKPIPGIEVKLFKVLKYEAARAFEWARETKLALVPESLDTKAFEKIASVTDLPFVTREEDPRVQLGKTIDVPEDVAERSPEEVAALDAFLGGDL